MSIDSEDIEADIVFGGQIPKNQRMVQGIVSRKEKPADDLDLVREEIENLWQEGEPAKVNPILWTCPRPKKGTILP